MFLILSLLFSAINPSIILLIGDGFGMEQMKAIEEKGYPWTFFEGFSVLDTRNPYCGVPDSASSITAILSGVFTLNGYIGIAINGKEYKTVGEIAKEKGYFVGVVTDVEIYNATTAGMFSHLKNRNDYEKIIDFLKKSNFDLFIGQSNLNIEKNFIKIDEEKDYLDYVKFALNKFKNKKPFFLLIELGRIDWVCHENDKENLKKELNKAKKVIEFLIDYYLKNRDFILYITADHETGGFNLKDFSFKTKTHTTEPVPIFSTDKFEEFLINQPHLNREILKKIRGE